MNKRVFYTISDALNYVESYKSRIERMPDLLGFKSSDISKNYKNLIQLSNSLSIIFMQYDLNDIALSLLKYSTDADTKLQRFATYQDKLWEGSLLTYNNLILLFQKVKHFKESLKLVFQAQNFILNIKKAKAKLSAEIEITTHMLSFISLWRVGRSSECITYIQSATDILNGFIEQKIPTKFSETTLDNLYGLIASSLASVKLIVERNSSESLSILQKALNDVNKNAGCRVILEALHDLISDNPHLKLSDQAEEDWLCGKVFNQLLLVTCFLPVIDHRTPIIKAEELESIKQHIAGENSSKKITKERPKKLEDRSWKREEKGRVRPWWESKKFLSEFEGRGREPSFASEPRKARGRVSGSLEVAKGIMFSPVGNGIKEIPMGGGMFRDDSYHTPWKD